MFIIPPPHFQIFVKFSLSALSKGVVSFLCQCVNSGPVSTAMSHVWTKGGVHVFQCRHQPRCTARHPALQRSLFVSRLVFLFKLVNIFVYNIIKISIKIQKVTIMASSDVFFCSNKSKINSFPKD